MIKAWLFSVPPDGSEEDVMILLFLAPDCFHSRVTGAWLLMARAGGCPRHPPSGSWLRLWFEKLPGPGCGHWSLQANCSTAAAQQPIMQQVLYRLCSISRRLLFSSVCAGGIILCDQLTLMMVPGLLLCVQPKECLGRTR